MPSGILPRQTMWQPCECDSPIQSMFEKEIIVTKLYHNRVKDFASNDILYHQLQNLILCDMPN